MRPIVVVGSINSDLVVSAPRIPQPGQTVFGSGFAVYPGGKGANQAVGVARLGHPCSLVGRLGRDSFGNELRSKLVAAEVATAAVGDVDGPSGVALITTAASGENSIVVVPGANAHLSPADIEEQRDLIRGAAMVLLQLEIPLAAVIRVIEIAFESHVPVMLDPAPAQALRTALLGHLAWLTPNATETAALLETPSSPETLEDAQNMAEDLLARGPAGVVLKLGHRGAFLATADGVRAHVPAFKVDAIDTTAAGDAFNAGFSTALVRGMEPVAAARSASAVAAISVTRRGAQPSMPTQREVEDFLRAQE